MADSDKRSTAPACPHGAAQTCPDCDGMGIVDGVGATCAQCKGAGVLQALEWKHEAAAVLAQFVHLSATPDRDQWAQAASRAIRLLNDPARAVADRPPAQGEAAARVRRLTFDEIDAVYEAPREHRSFQDLADALLRMFCEVNGLTYAAAVPSARRSLEGN